MQQNYCRIAALVVSVEVCKVPKTGLFLDQATLDEVPTSRLAELRAAQRQLRNPADNRNRGCLDSSQIISCYELDKSVPTSRTSS